jgi:hypothetical protein
MHAIIITLAPSGLAKSHGTAMTCQRCNALRPGTATAVVRGEIHDLKVCMDCARDAATLGLLVEPIDEPAAGPGTAQRHANQ